MRTFLICLVLPCLLTTSSSLDLDEPHDYRLESSRYLNRPSPFACSGSGATCDTNCRDFVFCSSGTVSGIIETCAAGQICFDGSCANPPARNPPCSPIADLDFVCSSPGMFPHPSDCKQYVICTSATAVPVLLDCEGAEGGYGYNPKTTFCDKKLTNRQCDTYPIPLCKAFEELPIVSNPTLYYKCRGYQTAPDVLYPHQMRCENGMRFSASTKRCA